MLWIILALVLLNALGGALLEIVARRAGFAPAALFLGAIMIADAVVTLVVIHPWPLSLALAPILPWSVFAGMRIQPTRSGEPFLLGDEPTRIAHVAQGKGVSDVHPGSRE